MFFVAFDVGFLKIQLSGSNSQGVQTSHPTKKIERSKIKGKLFYLETSFFSRAHFWKENYSYQEGRWSKTDVTPWKARTTGITNIQFSAFNSPTRRSYGQRKTQYFAKNKKSRENLWHSAARKLMAPSVQKRVTISRFQIGLSLILRGISRFQRFADTFLNPRDMAHQVLSLKPRDISAFSTPMHPAPRHAARSLQDAVCV